MATEREFMGDVLKWMAIFRKERPALNLGDPAQERQHADQTSSDLIIWSEREADALGAIELKTLDTPLSDKALRDDVIRKAVKVNAPYCVIWNQRDTQIFETPTGISLTSSQKFDFDNPPLHSFETIKEINTKNYINVPALESALKKRAEEILLTLASLRDTGAVGKLIVEPTIFVEWMSSQVREIRRVIATGIQSEAKGSRQLRTDLQKWSLTQSDLSKVKGDVLYERAAAQAAYRILGQAVFYLAYSGATRALRPMEIDAERPLREQLEGFWNEIKEIDYQALYEEDPLLDQLPFSDLAEAKLKAFLSELTAYDWNRLNTDVIGAVFERLIPTEERDLLGQYFTPPALADLIIAFCVDGGTDYVLDPACGTGEFLVRSYDRLKQTKDDSHPDLLEAIWGGDISQFPTELAVINLCRQDFAYPNNFPRVVTSDFFDLEEDKVFLFPPAQATKGQEKVPVTLPKFDAVIGNPPYLKWQKLDDLDPAYTKRLETLAENGNLGQTRGLDIYVLFFLHALSVVKPGGRIGFVTSNAWLTAEYGQALQRLLLRDTKLVAIIGSEAEPFFPQAAINTVVTILEKPWEELAWEDDYEFSFVTLKRTLSEIQENSGGDRWVAFDQLTSEIEGRQEPYEDELIRIRKASRAVELSKLNTGGTLLPWTLPMRAPKILLEQLNSEYSFA